MRPGELDSDLSEEFDLPFRHLRVWGLGFGVRGLGVGVWALWFGVRGLGFDVWGCGCGVEGVGFRV